MKQLLFTLLLIPLAIYASPVSKTDALRVAENFWWQEFKEHTTFRDYTPLYGFTEIYLFEESHHKGYVVISADDLAMPLLGYSRCPFQLQNTCPSLISWLRSYEAEIAQARALGIVADKSVNDEWDALRQGTPLPEPKGSKAVPPLLSSRWNQSSPYNFYCPGEGSDKAPTGCVATAIAQVMYYWKYPEHGTGYNEYNYADFTDTNFNWQYGTLSADFENTYYDWENMVDTLRSTSDSASIKAVALLNYHCGVALNMLYKPGGSMAFVTMEDNILFGVNHYPTSIAAENIIPRYFGYSSETEGRVRSEFASVSDWSHLLRDELQKGRPIVFAGAAAETPSTGHCFVIDGIDARSRFHINMGWGGASDNYYRISALSSDIQGFNYNYRQQAIIGMRPAGMFSVKVVCQGDKGENCGVLHGDDGVCGQFVQMVTGQPESSLTVVAEDGYRISAIVSGNDTIFKDGAVIDATNLTIQPDGLYDTIGINFADFTTDTELTVVFSAHRTFTVSVECNGENGADGGVFHCQHSTSVCGTDVPMENGDAESRLAFVAGEGYTVAAIAIDGDTLYKDGTVIDSANIIFPSANNLDTIVYDFSNYSEDAVATVLFKAENQSSIYPVERGGCNVRAFVSGRSIVVEGDDIGNGTIHDVIGRKIADIQGCGTGRLSIPVHRSGIYIVHIGGMTQKVIIRN